MRNQGIALRECENILQSKISKNELNNVLNLKANTNDVMRAINDLSSSIDNKTNIDDTKNLMNDKISKSELVYYLNSKPSIDEVKCLIDEKVDSRIFSNEINDLHLKVDNLQKNFMQKIPNFALSKDLNNMKKNIDEKANSIEVSNALNQKANKVTYDELSFATMEKIITVSTKNEDEQKRRLNEFESIKQFYANDDKGPNYGRVKSWFIKHYKDTYLEWYGKQHPKNKNDNDSTAKNETNEDNSATTNENE